MARISPHAVVDPRAILADDVEVGPFCVVGPDVTIGSGTKLMSHVHISGHTTIGRDNTFFPNSVVGTIPQDLKYKGEPTKLIIGDRNTVREGVTINTGTVTGAEVYGNATTRVGSNNLLMANAHVGHDVQIGDRCIIANNVMLAGHIVIGNNVVINGGAGITAFVTVGDFAYLAGFAEVNHDCPPFMKVSGRDEVRALNLIALQRAKFAQADIDALDDAARKLFVNKRKPFAVTLADYAGRTSLNPHVKQLVDFLVRRDQGVHGRYLEGLRKS
jgi:UDP-N-acetylglucosamine acyltransferase